MYNKQILYPGYQTESPFVPSLLVEFRKRLSDDVIAEINEIIIEYNTPNDPKPPTGGDVEAGESKSKADNNSGTMIFDATCSPQNIKYPQDVNLLNEVRENLEDMVDYLCSKFGFPRLECIVRIRGKIISILQNPRSVLQKGSGSLSNSSFSTSVVTGVILKYYLAKAVS